MNTKKPKGFSPPITYPQFHRYTLALRWMADQMGLRDWTVSLDFTSEEMEGVYATCTCPDNRKFATVALCAEWQEMHPEDQFQTLAHELMHCHLIALQTTLDTVIEPLLSGHQWNITQTLLHNNIECVVDDVGIAWASSMPFSQFRSIVTGKK